MRISVAAIFVLISGLASGQTDIRPASSIGLISGRVVDQTGAPIADAAVRLKAAAPDKITILAYTGRDGTFAFRSAPLKNYELKVEMAGFGVFAKTIAVGTRKDFELEDIVMSVANFSGPMIEGTLVVQGIAGTSATISMADLAELPQHTVRTTDRGKPATFRGVLLADVLSKVAVPTREVQLVPGSAGGEYRSTAASYYVVVHAKDGYRAVFAWAELDSTLTGKSVYLATKRDGKTLPDQDGPLQLVAPGEKSATRWVRQVASLRIGRVN